MFKYFLTLIAILTTIPAMGKLSDKPSEFRDPTPKDSKGWTATTGAQNLNTSSGSIYSQLKTEIDEKKGTYDDEGAVLLLVARNIYDNGGEFAWTQVQVANANGHRYTWIDYYDPDRSSASNAVTSIRLCNPGESCNSNEYGCNTQTQTLSDLFGKPNGGEDLNITLRTSGNASGIFTDSMNVLGYDNEENLEPTERTATHVLLGVIELKEHGAIVAPITVVGKRDPNGSGISSWINSVTYDASQRKLLCKEGWEQAGEDCVQTERCKNFNLQNNLCSGWTSGDYNETKHTIKQDICQDNDCNSKCNLFVCSSDTQGFKSESDRECIPCGETIKSGVIKTTKNNKAFYDKTYGKCEICAKGQRFDKTTNKCVPATEISTLQMKNGKNYETEDRKCWKYEDAEKFAKCVKDANSNWQQNN